MFWESRNQGVGSYIFSADMNNDGGTNDLIYIPRDASEMNFEQFTASGTTFTVAQQQAAWEAYIQQDSYLSKNRGRYAERGAVLMPFVHRADFSVAQDLFFKVKGSTQKFQVRMDILNFGNLLNENWGIGQAFTAGFTLSPLIPAASRVDAQGRALYRLRNIGTSLISSTYIPTANTADVYRIQIGLRYIFNK
jgi:hypothetical protein